MKFPLIILSLGISIVAFGQFPCIGNLEEYIFNTNKIQTTFSPQGHKFKGVDFSGFNVPYPNSGSPWGKRTMSSAAPWIGGFSEDQLSIATQRYAHPLYNDYYLGPLDTNGEKFIEVCDYFDRVWNVYQEEILKHIADFQSNGKIDDTIATVFGWPGEGNQFFSRFNGFELPQPHNGGWATFADNNFNGVYEPHLGEYPAVTLKGNLIHPDQIMWMIFNDQGTHTNSNGKPLGVEIQLTVFGYYCQDNTILNNSLFNNYKIINQSEVKLDSLFFGQFHDYDLGCDGDDYVGCDSLRNTEFAYNQDSIDGNGDPFCSSGIEGYGQHLPIQTLTYLSHPMYSFIKEGAMPSQTSLEFYRMLTGHWRNGAPITIGGDGMSADPGLPTSNFIFHGDPRDPDGWSELSAGNGPGRTQTISSVFLDELQPDEQGTVECVYMFHQDTTLSYFEQFGSMYDNVDIMADMVSDIENFCAPYPFCTDGDCVWPGDFNHDRMVDYRDLLYWGVTQGSTGDPRNGLVSWRGHFASDWLKTFPDGTNAKHQDSDGNGTVDEHDLTYNISNYLNTTPTYHQNDVYPVGPELAIVSEPMDQDGNIGFIRVVSQVPLHNVYGIAFELEFDTMYHEYTSLLQNQPLDTLGVYFIDDQDFPFYSFYPGESQNGTRYSFVGTSHENFSIPEGFTFLRIPLGLKQKYQLPLHFLPASFVFRLKNLVAIDSDGKDLQIGAKPYVVYNPVTTAIGQPAINEFQVYPNPCHDQLVIVSSMTSDVDMIDVHGKKVRTIQAIEFNKPIPLNGVTPGMYFLRCKEGQKIMKVIVQ